MEQAAEMYDLLSREAPWATVECYDSTRETMRSPKDIAQEVLAAVNRVISTQVAGNSGAAGN